MAPDPSLTPELIHARAFTVGFRGYDQSEVRDFLNRLSAEVRLLREQAERMESSWRSAEERAARPPVLDEETLMAAVGEETASILRAARASAVDLRTKASEDADRIRADAVGLLEEKTTEAEAAAAGIIEDARAEGARMLEKSRAEADDIRAKAEQGRALTIEGANTTREKILEDLSRRRRVATVQIEQLRAGRERLLESYAVVRRTLEEAQEDLTRADAEARAAADEVGRKLNREYEAQQPTASPGGSHAATPGPGGSSAAAVATAVDHPSIGGSGELEEDAVPHLRVVPDLDGGAIESVTIVTTAESGGAGDAEAAAGAAVGEPGAAADSPVEQLFAKIRAGRGRSKGGERAPAEEQPGAAAEAPPEEAGASEADQPVAGTVAEVGTDPAATDTAPAAASAAEAVPVAEAQTAAPAPATASASADEAWLQKREEAVSSLEVSLTRKLKRALQDEQNDLLDRLRGLRSEITAAALLPKAAVHRERYAKASRPLIDEAATAGAAFAATVLGATALGDSAPGKGTGAAPDVSSIASEAAEAIVNPLRRRLEQAIKSGASEDQAALVDSLGAAYREWKSQRVERIAGDALSAAFARGTWQAVPEGSGLRWIVDDVDGPCPDCDDDALAGGLPKGESFPTGQAHPPAHPGCRCLLVPVTG